MIAKTHRWQKTTIAAAAIALLGLSGTGAYALSLGRLTVQSALGEPLRAEIEVPDITAEEAASLKAAVAQPDAFTAAGLEYSTVFSSLQTSLQRKEDGRAYLRLTSTRSVNDPFIDLILEATWASGRIVRDYTLLLDPPSLKKSVPPPTLAQTTVEPSTQASATPSSALATKPSGTEPSRSAGATRVPAPTPQEAPAKQAPGSEKRVTVRTGDTATRIANANKHTGVSLDQMLVALLRSNPDAFVKNNLNRVRAGAVLAIPSAESATDISPTEASKIVVAQSKDFNEFRRSLAGNAPPATVEAAGRKASGTIEAKVDEKKVAPPAPDKLTLSKPAVSTKLDEARIAKERQAKDNAAREAELAKNAKELEALKAAANALPAKPAASQAAASVTVPVAAMPPASEPANAEPSLPAASASAPLPAEAAAAPQLAASEPHAQASAPVQAAVVPAPDEPAFLDTLLEDPLVPAGAAGLLALLGGYGVYRVRQRRKNASQVDSAFLESRLQPDSFFGASGGQRVDTNQNESATASSMVYSASQLDAADDVDPVAEADVYLAYGRDLQAEEILREAVRTNPGRLAIHTKLLEIFAKRRDTRNYESTATQAYKLTSATSPDWTRICEMGQSIDPGNPLYQPGGAPESASNNNAPQTGFGASTLTQPTHASGGPELGQGVDLDLDLDFSLDEETPRSSVSDITGSTVTAPEAEQTAQPDATLTENSMDMDFDLGDAESTTATSKLEPVGQLPEISLSLDDHDVPLGTDTPNPLRFDATSPVPVEPELGPKQTADNGIMDFDLGSLSMELDTPAETPVSAPDDFSEDPLGTKLALAEEFISIGDEDGARALIEEVMSEATGDMRAKAQKALAQLS